MVKAIDFAVRTSAGKVVRGAVSGEGGSEFLQVGSGETVSLNLSQSSVLGYERQGKDLVMKLSDGREITLSGYFESNPGADNKLYLSSNGEVTEVFLTDGGNGTMYANYGPVDTWNKYSNVDDIRFVEDNTLLAGDGYADDTAGMGPFVPGLLAGMGGSGLGAAAAIAGGAAVIGAAGGGSGGGGGGPTRIPPAVNDPKGSKDISTITDDKTVVVTGTGQPGEKVEVVIGDKKQTTTIKEDGKWDTKFEGDNFPKDGTHESVVTVTQKDGKTEVLDGPGFVIDLTPPAVSTTEGTVSVGDVENLVEYADGVTVAGKGEVGAKIVVSVEGGSHTTTVDSKGDWKVVFTKTEIAGGDYHEIPVTITATDKMGNATVITDKIAIDTVPHPLSFNSVTSDNVINKSESTGEVSVTGISTPGAEIEIKLVGSSIVQKVITNASGVWEAKYPAGTFANGDGERSFTATTTDAAGNASSSTHTIKVDTTASVSFTSGNLVGDINNDGTMNATESQNGVTMTGNAEIGSKSVTVEWNGHTQTTTTINADGTWSVTFPPNQVPSQPGDASVTSKATVTAIDQYNNTSAVAERNVTIDRQTSVSFDDKQAGGDNIITAKEEASGVALTGKAEAGAKVDVTYQGNTNTTTADSNGNWKSTFSKEQIKGGTFMVEGPNTAVTVVATDKAGNVKEAVTHPVMVDTEVQPFTAATNSYNTDKADKVLNNTEALDGLKITGTVEAGSEVMVQLGNKGPYPALVDGTNWTYTFAPGDIPTGDTKATLTVTAKDYLGNVSEPYVEIIDIDRIVKPFDVQDNIGGSDHILNANEVAAGLTLNGKGELNSTGVISLPNGQTQPFVVDSNGNWTVKFNADQLPRGNGTDMKITFTATDEANNTTSFTETVKVDTVAEDAPDVTNIIKSTSGAEGLNGVFLDEKIDNTFSFHRIDANGDTHSSISIQADSMGTKVVEFNGTTVPEGDFLVINNVDGAGNNSATLLVTNNTGTTNIDLGDAAFKDFDFAQLDLKLAPTNMTISAEDIIAITGPDNTLMIKGESFNPDGTVNDSIRLVGGAEAADQTGGPAGYTLYTLGDNASVYLDDDIKPTF